MVDCCELVQKCLAGQFWCSTESLPILPCFDASDEPLSLSSMRSSWQLSHSFMVMIGTRVTHSSEKHALNSYFLEASWNVGDVGEVGHGQHTLKACEGCLSVALARKALTWIYCLVQRWQKECNAHRILILLAKLFVLKWRGQGTLQYYRK